MSTEYVHVCFVTLFRDFMGVSARNFTFHWFCFVVTVASELCTDSLFISEIEDIFLDLAQKFGFQHDSMRNMFDFTMQLLDSRASRLSPNQALLTLHADYIGGENANYRKWYFAAQLNLDDAVGHSQNPGLQRLRTVRGHKGGKSASEKSLSSAQDRWRHAMNQMTQYDRLRQVALFLLCWGEAGNVRFMAECMCFIFKCADDYYRSNECQNKVDPVPEGLYLHTVIKPIYRFLRDQGYDSNFVRREKDHHEIIGYDDVNQLFWYPEGPRQDCTERQGKCFFFQILISWFTYILFLVLETIG